MTRSRDHDERLSRLLRDRGAEPLSFALTALAPPRDPGPLSLAADRIASYHWIVVTSRNAVPPLLGALDEAGTLGALTGARGVQGAGGEDAPGEERLPSGDRPRICAVGPGTAAALAEAGLPVDRIPVGPIQEGGAGRAGEGTPGGLGYTAEGVVAALAGRVEGLRILYPRAEGAREVIPRELGAAGARVEAVDAYRTEERPDEARRLAKGVDRGEVDVITFAAGSAVRAFARAWREGGAGAGGAGGGGVLPDPGGASVGTEGAESPAGRPWPPDVGVVAIGPITAGALEREGLPVHGIGEPHTLEGLVAAVETWVRKGGR